RRPGADGGPGVRVDDARRPDRPHEPASRCSGTCPAVRTAQRAAPRVSRPASPGQARAERLRILAFTDYFSESSCGGAERVTREVYKRLPDLGTDVMVLTATPFGDPG